MLDHKARENARVHDQDVEHLTTVPSSNHNVCQRGRFPRQTSGRRKPALETNVASEADGNEAVRCREHRETNRLERLDLPKDQMIEEYQGLRRLKEEDSLARRTLPRLLAISAVK
ncbi:hypothetical protein BOTBODRAFT_330283 [Botryobasidium botryosum FD-172 SS1]|uniref:Uncharacterized protein n=1 Tax=Botryobasidium botryosum (strain FD-172 SS1) TaxID=930990 RepID=A0A067MTF2_BOTB1|nr:hypothetical protein BOTBODRAFT_330283 [Botryobasidium botryosum FD-172 SS1]